MREMTRQPEKAMKAGQGVFRQVIMPPCSINRAGAVSRSKSSARWLREHFSDPFVKRAQAEGWRSRAVFKLEQIDRKERLIRAGMVILDLGAAPGAWSQYARRQVGKPGRVVATDILSM